MIGIIVFISFRSSYKALWTRSSNLQNITNLLPDAFADLKRFIKSYIPAVNAPILNWCPSGTIYYSTYECKPRLKCGRPIGSKYKIPKKRKGANNQDGHIIEAGSPEET